jgi:peptide/nickel transport system substrate-binding protein
MGLPHQTGKSLTRRAFLNASAAAGAAMLVPLSAASAQTPKRGGHLVIAMDGGSTTDTLDPATYVAPYSYTVGYQWGNCLVEYGKDNKIVPELAESWEPNSNATSWTFKLRKGVTFHNGKEFTAEDAIHTLNYHRGEKSKSPMVTVLKPIADVKANGKYELAVTLSAPNVDFPALLTDYHMLMMPAGGDPQSGMGTGGYIIEKFNPGVTTIAKRYGGYWKEGRANVDSIETLAINDATTRAAALQSGRAQIIGSPDTSAINLLRRDPSITLDDIPTANFVNLAMRCDVAPFDNLDLRLAMKYALNREEVITKAFGGFAKIGNDHPISPLDPFYDSQLAQYKYDPDKAAFHYKKSGHSGSLPLSICNEAFSGALDTAALYKEQARAAGITIEIDRVPDDGYWSDIWLKKPFYGGNWTGRPSPDFMLTITCQSAAPWNEAKWKSDKFDKLLAAARSELDINRRKQMYSDLETLVHDDSGLIVPLFRDFLYPMSKSVTGIVPTICFTGYRLAEQLYFV